MHLCNCLNSRRLNNASLNSMHPSPCCSRLSVDVCSLMYSGAVSSKRGGYISYQHTGGECLGCHTVFLVVFL